jgi:integral membrane protein
MSLGVPASATTPVGRFRIAAFWEGISYLLLLFVAMPLQYGLGIDMAVRVVGMAHGVLFLAYCLSLAVAARRLGTRLTLLAFVMSLVPGGTFWLETRLRRDEHEFERRAASPRLSTFKTIKAAYAAFSRNDPSALFAAMD